MRYDRPHDPESPYGAIYATLARLKGRRVCILHSKPPDTESLPELLGYWELLKRYIGALAKTLRSELKMYVTETSEWSGHDHFDVVIFPEVSFNSLNIIRENAKGRPPAALFIAMDMIEADTLRCDARITSQASVVEIMTQPYVYSRFVQ
jgi:hypothetical protein